MHSVTADLLGVRLKTSLFYPYKKLLILTFTPQIKADKWSYRCSIANSGCLAVLHTKDQYWELIQCLQHLSPRDAVPLPPQPVPQGCQTSPETGYICTWTLKSCCSGCRTKHSELKNTINGITSTTWACSIFYIHDNLQLLLCALSFPFRKKSASFSTEKPVCFVHYPGLLLIL